MKAKTIIIIIIALVLSLVGGALAASCSSPVSMGCKRACAHVDGPGYVDCVLMCMDIPQ